MANDSMRAGPKGSSEQMAYFGATRFVLSDRTTFLPVVVKSGATTAATLGSPMGTDWRVIAVEVLVTQTFATADIDLDVGILGATTAHVDAFATGAVDTAAGTVLRVPLNGATPTTTFGATNGFLVASNAASSGATGAYQLPGLAAPVSGEFYSD